MSTEGRKYGQAARREMRRNGKIYRDQFIERLKIFNECLKPKPKYVPKGMWRWLVSLAFDLERFEKELNDPKPMKKKPENPKEIPHIPDLDEQVEQKLNT